MEIWNKDLANLQEKQSFFKSLTSNEYCGEIKKKGDSVWFCLESLIPKEILDKLELVEDK